MNLKKLVTAAVCTMLMAAVAFTAGCGGEKKSDKKVLKVGMECAYAPYNWTQPDDSNGAVQISGSSDYAYGYDVMMAKKIADELGYDLEIVKLDWDSLVPAVQSGQVDCVIAGQSITKERQQMVDFTDPYYYASIITLVKNDGDYKDAASVEDLKGATVTSQQNTIWYDSCLPQIEGAQIQTAAETAPAMLMALETGTVDFICTDMPTAMGAVAAYPDMKILDFTGSEDEIYAGIRELVSMLPANNEDDLSYTDCEDDLNRVCADLENAAEDAALALSMISDNGVFIETKKAYAKDMVTGFIRLNGMTVGAVANRSKVYDEEGNTAEEFDGTLSAMGCKKAAAFVKFCDAFGIPVLTLTNVKGLKATACSEKNLAREMAALTYAFADATVPKVNVITGKAFGSAYVTMNSKAIGADMVYAWPEAEIGMMAADMAAKIMYTDADADTLKAKTEEYKALQSSPLSAAGRGYVDTIIEPVDTRKYVIGAFEMLFTKREERPSKKHGTI